MRLIAGIRFAALAASVGLSACASAPTLPIAYGSDTVYGGSAAVVPPSADKPSIVRPSAPLECVAFARDRSGIQLYGDAYTWWDQARGLYGEETLPSHGAVMVLMGYAGPKHGHLAVVTRVVSAREIRVDHANWLNDGNVYLNAPVIDVSPANDWTQVRIWNTRDGHLGGNTYTVQGFILPGRAATS